ncbi:tannase/feruloyl esterase family alpha/beta hydrolase, partial [uncultured Caballeronia sp.]|uniref:tannase/feruloyl esterase family alpha/beta hydrolase n=1 Tax=uncultured Caballeronia sp. TaxID=1827198 RepID=UPI001575CDCA
LADAQDFYRLFMLPGIGHCGTGIGPDNIGEENYTAVSPDPEHDVVSALEAWVERGSKPKKLIASQYVNNDPTQGIQMQRPICPFPADAVYDGSGNPNLASSFKCAVPAPDQTSR